MQEVFNNRNCCWAVEQNPKLTEKYIKLFSWFLGYIILFLFLFFSNSKQTYMTYAGGKWNLTVQCIVNKQIWKVYILWNKIWSLSLAMLKCESRTSLHAVQWKCYCYTVILLYCIVTCSTIQSGSVLMFYSYYFKKDTFFICSVEQQAWLCFKLVLEYFSKIKV